MICISVFRLIPAHAGKTSHASSHAGWGWAHPRSRGENQLPHLSLSSSLGSSPLTRGKPHRVRSSRSIRRLIPAHAGKTEHTVMPTRFRAAHPRSRGENAQLYNSPHLHTGSSPLTRGKRVGVTLDVWRRGLIPAHAGKTVVSGCPTFRGAAHPRSRGENAKNALKRPLSLGSSPLTRGKPHREPGRNRTCRLIPAHAGKTRSDIPAPGRRRAHPRSRGEN